MNHSSREMKRQQGDQRDATATIGLHPPSLALKMKTGGKDPRILVLSRNLKTVSTNSQQENGDIGPTLLRN